jgi:hypothetical protein
MCIKDIGNSGRSRPDCSGNVNDNVKTLDRRSTSSRSGYATSLGKARLLLAAYARPSSLHRDMTFDKSLA